MSGPTLQLADDFTPPSREDWLALVEKTLKGETFADALVRRTADGIDIVPLYTDAPATVRDLAPRDASRPWDLRTAVRHPDPARANREILRDLESGAASVLLSIDPRGETGVAVGDAAKIGRAHV